MNASTLGLLFAIAAPASPDAPRRRPSSAWISGAISSKLLYQQGGDFGVVRCKAATTGALSQCQNVKVTLHD